LVIGGGATGCGVALDAASRGLAVALAERGDFAGGTSGRSTKLLHGGVRYLERALTRLDRGQFHLVREALHERGVLLRTAPHLCHRLPLVIPLYRALDIPYFLAGLTLYDLMAGGEGIGKSRLLSRGELLEHFPLARGEGLQGGILYYDGQFNDARLNLALALTAVEEGAALASYLEVVGLLKEGGRVAGARVRERFSGEEWEIRARCVVNACGPWADELRRLDDPQAAPLLTGSSGSHLVLPGRYAPAGSGLLVPRTEDGRVLFILPWQGKCLVGTTEEPASPSRHPQTSAAEIDYLLRHARRYLSAGPERGEVLSFWAGVRPLLRDPASSGTAGLSRDHAVACAPSGLITIAGGKWTTYRRMAQDTVDCAVRRANLAPPGGCRSEGLVLSGGRGFDREGATELAARPGLSPESARHLAQSYGDRAGEVAELCRAEYGEPLAPGHPYLKGELLWALKEEWALTAADFLARRLPLALLDRQAALAAAPFVLETMARELGWDGERLAGERAELWERLAGAL